MASLGVAVVRQYERGVVFRLGRLRGVRDPGLRWMIPLVDRLRKVSLRTVTMPIPSQQVITRDDVSIGAAAVACYRVVDPIASLVEIESVQDAIDRIARTTVRNVVGRSALDQVPANTETLNEASTDILDVTTKKWGVLPESMQRAVARGADGVVPVPRGA